MREESSEQNGGPTFGERRRQPRYPAIHLGLVQGLDRMEDTSRPILGRTLNLSAGGALIEIQERIPPGAWIQLSCTLADELLEVRARVLSCDPAESRGYQARLSFVHLDAATRELIETHLSAREE